MRMVEEAEWVYGVPSYCVNIEGAIGQDGLFVDSYIGF